jgi:hypothetical protein
MNIRGKKESLLRKEPSMRRNYTVVISAILFFAEAISVNAQTPHSLADSTIMLQEHLVLRDGSEFNGHVISESKDSMLFETLSGKRISIYAGELSRRSRMHGSLNSEGEFEPLDPNRTRTFLAPTARTLEQGTGYFADYELFFSYFGIGVADAVTLSGGFSIIPGSPDQLFYLSPKVRFLHVKNADASVGVLYINSFGAGAEGLGLAYAVTTLGSDRTSVSIGYGKPFIGDVNSSGLLLLSGEAQVSGSLKLISENWIPLSGDSPIISFGFRFFGDHVAADLGFVRPLGVEDFGGWPFIPWVGFAYNFGSPK